MNSISNSDQNRPLNIDDLKTVCTTLRTDHPSRKGTFIPKEPNYDLSKIQPVPHPRRQFTSTTSKTETSEKLFEIPDSQ